MEDKILAVVNRVERTIVRTLLLLMLVVVFFAAVQLIIGIFKSLTNPPYLELLTASELPIIYGAFLMVLIGIELVQVIRTYLQESYIRVEFVLIVALIAVAKSVIVLDYDKSPELILALAALVLALAGGYFLLKRAKFGKSDSN